MSAQLVEGQCALCAERASFSGTKALAQRPGSLLIEHPKLCACPVRCSNGDTRSWNPVWHTGAPHLKSACSRKKKQQVKEYGYSANAMRETFMAAVDKKSLGHKHVKAEAAVLKCYVVLLLTLRRALS